MIQYLEQVERELSRYEHPLFNFSAQLVEQGIAVKITLKPEGIYDNPYYFLLIERDLKGKGFPWAFQRQLYDCLHDYIAEMFTRTPQIRE